MAVDTSVVYGPVGEFGRPRHPVTVEIRGFKSRQGRVASGFEYREPRNRLAPGGKERPLDSGRGRLAHRIALLLLVVS